MTDDSERVTSLASEIAAIPASDDFRVGFLLVPGFSLVALSCAIDVLRAAKLEAPHKNIGWHMLGGTTGTVESSSGISLDVAGISSTPDLSVVAVCGGDRTHLFQDAGVEGWLKRLARSGVKVGSISDGAFLLARTGLFDRCRSTIHWKCQTAYRELFPHLDARTSILEIDGARFSCAGGTASLDLMLRLLTDVIGPETAGRIADNYVHDTIRGAGQTQTAADAFRFAGRDPLFRRALFLMAQNLEAPIPIATIADRTGVNHRQLDRMFRRHLRCAPSTHYRELRLMRASALLKQSGLSVSEIAAGCGFQSASHLGRHFKQRFGETPSLHRRAL